MADIHNWLNPQYIDRRTILSARHAFLSNTPNHIQLQNILNENALATVRKEVEESRWTRRTIPDMHSYATAKLPKLAKLIASPDFLNFLKLITGPSFKSAAFQACAFSHRDYTLLHDEIKAPAGTLFELDFTKRWSERFGGTTHIIDNNKETLRVQPSFNTLTLIRTPAKTRHFVEYVNHHAGKHARILVRGILV